MLLSVLKRIFLSPGAGTRALQRGRVAPADILDSDARTERSGRIDPTGSGRSQAPPVAPDGELPGRPGESLLACGGPHDAIRTLELAAAASLEDPIVHFRLAGAYLAAGRRDEGIACLRKAAAMQGGFVPALNDLGNACKERGLLDEAEAHYRSALQRDPEYAIAWHNLGCVLRDTGELAHALECFDRALLLEPDHHDARLARALLLLGTGRLQEGWRDYRARWALSERRGDRRGFPYPEWQGERLDGCKLLIWGEQGVGDELLFASLCGEVAGLCARCALECHAKLVPLLQRSLPSVEVIPWRSPPDVRLRSGFDYQISLGELAAILRPDRASFSRGRAYLRADPDRAAYWRSRLRESGTGLQVGFCWRSRDLSGERALACATLEQWSSVFSVAGVQFVCLQYDDCRAEVEAASRRLGVDIRFLPDVDLLDDLDETAALMGALDLVISAPTAVSVQAAALGIETWQLSYGYDWQYGDAARHLWLPSMVRFHRHWAQSWDDVLNVVADRLRERVRNEPAPPGGPAAIDPERKPPTRAPDPPEDFETLYAAAERAAQAGHNSDAVMQLRRALAARPDAAHGHLFLGDLARRLGRWDEMIEAFRAALKLLPEQPGILVNLGAAYEAKSDLDQAEHCYREALRLDPRMAAAYLNLGNVQRARGALAAARESYENALIHRPGSAKAHANLANLYKLQGDLGAAERHFRAALAMDPENVRLLLGLGAALHDMGLLDDALAFYRQALLRDPDYREARLNMAHALLAKGDLERGWPMLEVRFDLPGAGLERRHAGIPAWSGEPLADKSLVVWGEQGIGDEIVFASMYPDLPSSSHHVVVECHGKLRKLFQRSFPNCRVVAYGEMPAAARSKAAFDFQVAAGSLGALLRAGRGSFPARRGYLVADEARCDHWRERLARLGPGPKVGFCWRSSNLEGERALSCTRLADWHSLFAIDGVHWISLQYDECLDELQQAAAGHPNRIYRFDDVDYRDDLDEVSALIKGLDLVISAPTTVSAHAAALGVETWQFSFGADWQTLGTRGNPWLPAIRRYPRAWTESWEGVFARIGADLVAAIGRERQATGAGISC